MSKKSGFWIGLSLFLLIPSLRAQAADDVPQSFQVLDIKSFGDGCPAGTTALNISEDREAFTLSFSSYLVELQAGDRTETRKACRVVFDTINEAGWEYTVLALNVRGFASLSEGAVAEQTLRFGLKDKESDATTTLVGPIDTDYVWSRERDLQGLKWSGCQSQKQKDFTIQTSIQIKALQEEAQGLLTVDSLDGAFSQDYELLWRSCKANGPKKQVAICRLNGTSDFKKAMLLSKGIGKTAEQALQKAEQKLLKKCQKSNKHAAFCGDQKPQCSVLGAF